MPTTPAAFTRRSLLAAGAAGAAFAGAPAAARSGAWSRGADLPLAVQEIYPALLDGRIYVVGGLAVIDGELGISDRTVVYDAAADAWSEGPAFPEPRHHPYAVGCAGRVYAFGGFSEGEGGIWNSRTTTHVLDPAAPDAGWRGAAPMPRPQAETVAAVLGGRIHLVGGRRPAGARNAQWFDQADVTAHQIYDPEADAWDIGLPAPTARNSAACAVIDGRLHVVGGRTVGGGNTAAHEVLTVGTGGPGPGMSWDAAAPLPQAQGGLAAAAVGGKLYAFGGEYFGPGGGGVYPEAWVYDPAADAWEAIEPMPTPRHGLGAAAIGDAIYVLGGAAKASGEDTTALLEIYRPD